MNCTYCGTRNSEGDHRCRRCGRRLHLPTAQPVPVPYPATKSSAAPALAEGETAPRESARAALPELPPRQRGLFPSQVLQFEDYSVPRKPPARPQRRPSKPRKQPARSAATRRRERLEAAGQQAFDLQPARPVAPPESKTGVTPARCCQHPVAHPVHRLIAATLDFSLIVTGLGLFLAILRVVGGAAALNVLSIPIIVAVAGGILVFYRALWWLAGRDSPGMIWSRLRLLDFDGRVPSRKQRAHRFAGTFLSVAAGGLGLIWAIGDEEKLGWNDHISRTFPTPRPPSEDRHG